MIYYLQARNKILHSKHLKVTMLLKLLYTGWISLDDSMFGKEVWFDLDNAINSKFWESNDSP